MTIPGNFIDDRHALYVGWVVGLAIRNGLDVTPSVDNDGNYTDRFEITLHRLASPMSDPADATVTVVVPYPPKDWSLTD